MHNPHSIKFTFVKHTIQWFLAYLQSCAINTNYGIPDNFRHPERKPYTHDLLLWQPLTCFLPHGFDSPTLGIYHKWNLTTRGLLCLAFCTSRNVFEVQACWSVIHMEAWSILDKAVLYDWLVFHCMVITHFGYPFINWWVLALWDIINNAVLNIWMAIFAWTCVSNTLGYIAGSEIAGTHGNSTSNLCRTGQPGFQSCCAIFVFPPATYEGSSCFNRSLPTFVFCQPFLFF